MSVVTCTTKHATSNANCMTWLPCHRSHGYPVFNMLLYLFPLGPYICLYMYPCPPKHLVGKLAAARVVIGAVPLDEE